MFIPKGCKKTTDSSWFYRDFRSVLLKPSERRMLTSDLLSVATVAIAKLIF